MTNTPRAGEQSIDRLRGHKIETVITDEIGAADPTDKRTDSEKLGYDAALKPKHYLKWAIEPFLFIRENNLPFWAGSVIKYILRFEDKNGIEDLRKAMRNIELEIFRRLGHKEWNKTPSRIDGYAA